jgi:hypothetical protein
MSEVELTQDKVSSAVVEREIMQQSAEGTMTHDAGALAAAAGDDELAVDIREGPLPLPVRTACEAACALRSPPPLAAEGSDRRVRGEHPRC